MKAASPSRKRRAVARKRWAIVLMSIPVLQLNCDLLAEATSAEMQNLVMAWVADVTQRVVTNVLGIN